MMTFIVIILVLVVLVILAALLIGKEMRISREVTINQKVEKVYEFLLFIGNHKRFSVWMQADPEMKTYTKGTDGTIGFIYAWDSAKNKNVGAGEQEIIRINPLQSIEYELRFVRPMKNVAKATFLFSPANENQTKVEWVFEGPMKIPMNLLKGMFAKMLGNDLQLGLNNLKTVLETKM